LIKIKFYVVVECPKCKEQVTLHDSDEFVLPYSVHCKCGYFGEMKVLEEGFKTKGNPE